ncbi:MAG: hypothetical protein IMZ52_02405, partial [Actinobacteria bacterium]|nr:hypothetical protein [Actinomycetota bacterium]
SALVYLKDAIEIKKKLEKENTCILKDEPLRVLGEAIYELDYYRRKWIEEGKYTERWVTNDEILLYLI